MKLKLRVLIVDDHPLIAEILKTILLRDEAEGFEFIINKAENCEIGYHRIMTSLGQGYDIVVLDFRLPPSSDGKIKNGKDLGEIVRKLIPNAKLIILTGIDDNFQINSIYKTLKPEGFLIKSDIRGRELAQIFHRIIFNPPYYSSSVLSILNDSKKQCEFVDDVDIAILHYLSKGILTKDLPNYIPLSIAAIEKRKRQLKQYFNAEGKGDFKLIKEAWQKKLI